MPSDPETLFSLAGGLAAAAWALLILGPRRIAALDAAVGLGVPALLSLGYAALALPALLGAEAGGFGSLAEVRALLSSDLALLAGWVHWLAFDLLVGAWLAARLDRVGIARTVQAPILLATFLVGPVGLVLGLATEALAPRLAPRGAAS